MAVNGEWNMNWNLCTWLRSKLSISKCLWSWEITDFSFDQCGYLYFFTDRFNFPFNFLWCCLSLKTLYKVKSNILYDIKIRILIPLPSQDAKAEGVVSFTQLHSYKASVTSNCNYPFLVVAYKFKDENINIYVWNKPTWSFYFHEWSRQNFSLQYHYSIKQKTNENLKIYYWGIISSKLNSLNQHHKNRRAKSKKNQ